MQSQSNTLPYSAFLQKKTQHDGADGFAPRFIPEWLFPFQQHLVEWAVQQWRAAIFADCGLGKRRCSLPGRITFCTIRASPFSW